jgi:hypothetical protein
MRTSNEFAIKATEDRKENEGGTLWSIFQSSRREITQPFKNLFGAKFPMLFVSSTCDKTAPLTGHLGDDLEGYSAVALFLSLKIQIADAERTCVASDVDRSRTRSAQLRPGCPPNSVSRMGAGHRRIDATGPQWARFWVDAVLMFRAPRTEGMPLPAAVRPLRDCIRLHDRLLRLLRQFQRSLLMRIDRFRQSEDRP